MGNSLVASTGPSDVCLVGDGLTSAQPSRSSGLFSIRPFERNDYPDVSAVNNHFSPYLTLSPRELEFADKTRDSRCLQQRWVAHHGERMAGYAVLSQPSESYSPTRFQFQIYVLPEFEAKGLEEDLLKTVIETFQGQKGAHLRCVVASERTHFSAVLEKSGFKPSMRFWDQVHAFGESVSEPIERWAREAPGGIDIRSFASLSREDRDGKLFDLENRLKNDIPFPDDLTMKFEYFQNAVMGSPGLLQDGSFAALDGDRYVGVSYLFRRDGNEIAYVRLTGVLPSYRKRGIALHLKALTLQYAARNGFRGVFTRSEESNQAIKALNEKCGFETRGLHVNWSRAF